MLLAKRNQAVHVNALMFMGKAGNKIKCKKCGSMFNISKHDTCGTCRKHPCAGCGKVILNDRCWKCSRETVRIKKAELKGMIV